MVYTHVCVHISKYIYIHDVYVIHTHHRQFIAGHTHKKLARRMASRKEAEDPEQKGDFHWYCFIY